MVTKALGAFCLIGLSVVAVVGLPLRIPGRVYVQPQQIKTENYQQQFIPPYQHDQRYFNELGSLLPYNRYPGLRTIAAPALAPQVYKHPYAAGVAPRTAAILRQAQDSSLDGAYSYGFESEDGIALQTSAGPLTPVGPEDSIQTVSGSYSYTAPDGTPITTNWIADENGFRAEGAHLPKAPETTYRTA